VGISFVAAGKSAAAAICTFELTRLQATSGFDVPSPRLSKHISTRHMSQSRHSLKVEAPGLAARRVAADILDGVLRRHRPLDEQLEDQQSMLGIGALAERDRALVRNIVATALRRLGTIRHILGALLDRGMPTEAPRVEPALIVGATQILFMDVPDHAAVDLSVRLVQNDRRAAHFSGLVNAVLRRVTQTGRETLAGLDTAKLDAPDWLLSRWSKAYGDETALDIVRANGQEPALDLTVKSDAEEWAARMRGILLPNGTVRMVAHGPVSLLPGFTEGAWWVQDAAAAIPARLLGDVKGKRIADICAAPGGKTAQLAAMGAKVTAVDRSERRLQRVVENLQRLQLSAEIVVADATEWQPEPFDGVLIDAPCTSTGTIRRHPDIAWLKREGDLVSLVDLQRRLLAHAVDLVVPGGAIVFCTCSLEPEEGEHQIAELLAREPRLRRHPIGPAEFPGLDGLVNAQGDIRTLPNFWPNADPRLSGMDGFFAARLMRV
jgi:16S rRNA (cytosine967-C5)-methyltransferase